MKDKKVNVLQLVAALCLLFGCVINLLSLCIEIPRLLHACSLPLLLVSVVLHVILLRKYTRDTKEKQQKTDANSKK